jgi:hypothetical protein
MNKKNNKKKEKNLSSGLTVVITIVLNITVVGQYLRKFTPKSHKINSNIFYLFEITNS